MINKRLLGARGEREAERYLISMGATVLERNMRCPAGEIDLIIKTDGRICFVEVKTRSSSAFGTPAEAVDYRKRIHIIRSAAWYLQQKHLSDSPTRFDVVEVTPEGIRHIPGAFTADG